MQRRNREQQSGVSDPFAVMERRAFGDFDDMFQGFFGNRGFGGSMFGGSIFGGGSLMERRGRRDPFGDFGDFGSLMSGFDDIRMPGDGQVSRLGAGGPGHCVSQTYVYSSKMGADGKLKVEKYYNSSVQGVDREGKRVGQSEEMYNNTETGIKKIAQQRTLGDKARKVVKTKVKDGRFI